MARTCNECEFTFAVESWNLIAQEARFCPSCGNELDTEKWPHRAFSEEDLWGIVESDSDYPEEAQELFDEFIKDRGTQADETCWDAVMTALRDEFEDWLAEIEVGEIEPL